TNIDDEETFIEMILFDEISNYVSDMINRLGEYDTLLVSTFCIKLNKATLKATDTEVEIMAKLIVDEIEEADDLDGRKTDRFDCNSKLTIHIDIPAEKAKIVLQYKLIHETPIDIATPLEIKQEIMKNL
ncbi:1460_t:CDS:2, partial [Racocetra fulgida]